MTQKRVLIKNIQQLLQVRDTETPLVQGHEMKNLPGISNAFLAIEDGKIAGYGSMEDWEGITDWNNLEIIDARDKLVMPSFVDSHTHVVYANSREGEFRDRLAGLSYEEIAARGGGILNSAASMAAADEDTLYTAAKARIDKLMRQGTGAIEIKSGYGLSEPAELKMLRVIQRLKEELPIPVKATYLGAHAIPKPFKNNREAYFKEVLETIPKVAAEGLADYVDIFCEKNYFTLEETEQLIQTGNQHGLKAKVHVNQFNALGAIPKCCELGALSVDHLEVVEDADIKALQKADTIAVALPSCSFFLQLPYTPVRQLMEANIPVALASDYNPGSTPSGNLSFVFALACIQMKMLPEEALNALTINAAAAMELQEEVGSISVGKRANLIITKPVSELAYLPYAFGDNHIDRVLVNGETL